jgi:hypothetical protein
MQETKKKVKQMAKNKDTDLIKIGEEVYKKTAFMIEDEHPAIGRILIVDDRKYKVLDGEMKGPHRSGTFIAPLTEEDELRMEEYEEALDDLADKMVSKVDVKRMIKENIRSQPLQDIKTGLYILNSADKGAKMEENHLSGCYQLDFHLNRQTYSFITGADVRPPFE